MPVIDGADVAEAGVIPVGHVEAAIGADTGPHGAEPAVGGGDELLFVLRAEGGAVGEALADIDEVVQGVWGDDFALVGATEQAAFINGEGLREALVVALVAHVLEPAEGIRIGERAVFAPAFDAVAALLVVHAASGSVRAGKEAAFAVEVEAEGVSAALGVDFKSLLLRMVAPDALAFPFHVLGVGTADVAGGGAAVGTVQPAVHAPLQIRGDAVRVFEAEAAELDFGISIWLGIEVSIRIAEEVRRIEHPDATHAMQRCAGDVQAGDDILVLVEKAVAVRVFEDGDLVRALRPARRRRRNLVKLRPQVLVVADDFQSGGELILAIHRDPHAALRVPTDIKRLLHIRLGGHEVDRHVAAQLELLHGLRRRRRRRVISHHAAAGPRLHDLFHGLVAGDVVEFDLRVGGEGGAAEREEEKARIHGG